MDIALSVAALVVGLVLLEAGAERFTGAIGAIARRLRASEGVVGLLTAGGEWEELIVVALALASGHPALAVGNVVGSCLANLIGSMPLGLLGKRPLVLDRSARVYGLVMLGVTVLACLFAFGGRVTRKGARWSPPSSSTSPRSWSSSGAAGCVPPRTTMMTTTRRWASPRCAPSPSSCWGSSSSRLGLS